MTDKRKEELQGAASWMIRSASNSVRWRVESPQEATYLRGLLENSGNVTTENRGSYFEVVLVTN